MMQWHARNNRHAMRRPRGVEAHLGDVIGEPLVPMRPNRSRHQPFDWLKRLNHVVVTTAGVTFWSMLLIALLVSMFLAARPVFA